MRLEAPAPQVTPLKERWGCPVTFLILVSLTTTLLVLIQRGSFGGAAGVGPVALTALSFFELVVVLLGGIWLLTVWFRRPTVLVLDAGRESAAIEIGLGQPGAPPRERRRETVSHRIRL